MDLGPRRHEDDVGSVSGGLDQDVGAACRSFGRGVDAVGAVQNRKVLPGQDEAGGAVGVLQDRPPAGGGLVGVPGAYDVESGNRAQRREVFHGLVGGAVLAQSDRVVGPHVGGGELHQGGEADGGAHVVAEREERAAVRAGQALQGDAVEHGAHRVLTDTEVQGPAVGASPELGRLPVRGDEGGFAVHGRVVAAREVGGAAPQFGQDRREGGEHLAGGLAGGHALRVRGEVRQGLGPSFGQFLLPQPVEQRRPVRVGGAPLLVGPLPAVPGVPAPFPDGPGVGEDLLLHGEGRIGVEAQEPLGARDLLVPQGRPVRLSGVPLRGGGPADDRAQHDE